MRQSMWVNSAIMGAAVLNLLLMFGWEAYKPYALFVALGLFAVSTTMLAVTLRRFYRDKKALREELKALEEEMRRLRELRGL